MRSNRKSLNTYCLDDGFLGVRFIKSSSFKYPKTKTLQNALLPALDGTLTHAQPLTPPGNAQPASQSSTRWSQELAPKKHAVPASPSTPRLEYARSYAPRASKELAIVATTSPQTASASPPPSCARDASTPEVPARQRGLLTLHRF